MSRKNKFIADISINAIQSLVNQVSGVIIFFIVSRELEKSSLGQINWSFAILMMVFPVLGFGIEPIVLRKTARGEDPAIIIQTHLVHVGLTGIGFMSCLGIAWFLIPTFRHTGLFFLLLSLSQCLSFFAIPFRQIASGLEKFKALFLMATAASFVKISLLLLLTVLHEVNMYTVIYVYLSASFCELLLSFFVARFQLDLKIFKGYNRQYHFALLKESFPQLGINILNITSQRMDMVLLGILSTSVMVAEYSFSGRLFDLTIIPLSIIAPVLFPKLARMFKPGTVDINNNQINKLKTFARIEIVAAVFVALVLNICWTDLIDLLTHNKYGKSTRILMMIMSFAMPLAYLNNLLWGINFAGGKMTTIFKGVLLTLVTVVAADILLIPVFNASGAAIAFVFAEIIQAVYYARNTEFADSFFYYHLLLICFEGIAAFSAAFFLFTGIWIQLSIAIILFLFLLLLSGELRISDWSGFKSV